MKNIETLRAQVYRKFVDALASRNLSPGQIVTQRQLVELTGFPLGAVRELIPRLEGDGLIHTLNRRGLQIAPVDVNLVRNAYQLRLILEKEGVIRLTRDISAEEIETIKDQHRDIVGHIGDGSLSPFVTERAQQMDWAFHERIISSMGNDIVSEIYRVNSIKIRLTYQGRLRLTAQNLKRVFGEHLAIIEAIQKRDEAGAAAALTYHIEASRSVALGEDPGLHEPGKGAGQLNPAPQSALRSRARVRGRGDRRSAGE
jgi:DNA-binding GntR family transcriptional regulator